MKRQLLIVAMFAALLSSGISYAGQPVQWSICGDYLFPGDDETWDAAYGGTVKAAFWQDDKLGFALSLGAQQWQTKESDTLTEFTDLGDDFYYISGISLEGEALMVPIALSALYQAQLTEKVKLVIEGGAKYVFVNSDLKASAYEGIYDAIYDEIVDATGVEDKIDIDNGVVAFIAADVQVPIGDFVGFAGAGYQVDVVKGEAKWLGEKIADNELKAAFIRAGLIW